jgi:hypothetical protein
MTCTGLWRILQGSTFSKSKLKKRLNNGFQSVISQPKENSSSENPANFPPSPPKMLYDTPFLNEEEEETH